MKSLTVSIDGTDYTLKLGFGVMMQFEDEFSIPITRAKSLRHIAKLLHISLSYNNPDFIIPFKTFIDTTLEAHPSLINSLTDLLFSKVEDDAADKKKVTSG